MSGQNKGTQAVKPHNIRQVNLVSVCVWEKERVRDRDRERDTHRERGGANQRIFLR
jgi:hypothetical protein